jgi:hypothetical protein
MAKTKKQSKQQQANMQSDNMEMAGCSEVLTMSSNGVETTSMNLEDTDFTYSFGDLGQLDLFSEEDMREKYPALKQAHEHYQSVLEVCKTKEKEDEV